MILNNARSGSKPRPERTYLGQSVKHNNFLVFQGKKIHKPKPSLSRYLKSMYQNTVLQLQMCNEFHLKSILIP